MEPGFERLRQHAAVVAVLEHLAAVGGVNTETFEAHHAPGLRFIEQQQHLGGVYGVLPAVPISGQQRR